MDIDNFIKLLNLKLYLGKPGDTQGKKKQPSFVLLLASLSPKILHQKYRFGLDSLL